MHQRNYNQSEKFIAYLHINNIYWTRFLRPFGTNNKKEQYYNRRKDTWDTNNFQFSGTKKIPFSRKGIFVHFQMTNKY